MNRTLLTALTAAAVIGITAGGVTAVQVGGEDERPSDRTGSAGPAAADSSASPSHASTSSGVLWATRRVLHDGDQEVRIDLDGDGTVVYVCELDGVCEEVGRSSDAAGSAVLGELG